MKSQVLSFSKANKAVRLFLSSNGGYRSTGTKKIITKDQLREALGNPADFDVSLAILSQKRIVVLSSQKGTVRLNGRYRSCCYERYQKNHLTECKNSRARRHGIGSCPGIRGCQFFVRESSKIRILRDPVVDYPFTKDLYVPAA